MTATSSEIIVALDYADEQLAYKLADSIKPSMCKLKIGKEMFTRFGPSFVSNIVSRGYDVFLDLKFHDIPTTVARACDAAASLGIWMLNVHASGGTDMMQVAKEAAASTAASPLVTAVTVLTSMDDDALRALGIQKPLQQQVLSLAQMAHQAGLDGVVCSAQEAREVKHGTDKNFLLVTPGIRPQACGNHDQKRVMTPLQATQMGADYLVIGRPVTQSDDPASVLRTILSEIC